MTEAHATAMTAAATAASIAGASRPRVSALSFKDLTARLKKTDVPSITPVVAPLPTPAVVQPQPVVERPVVAAPAVAWPSPPVPIPEPVLRDVVLAPVVEEPPAPEPKPYAGWAETQVVEAAPPVETLEPLAAPEPVALAPEPVEEDLVAKNDAANEQLRELAKSRQHQIELDLIWRMLLATPTAEDRNVYLQEAQSMMGEEAEPLPPTKPEFDLSAIAPADAPSTIEPVEADVEHSSEEPGADVVVTEEVATESSELARSLLDMMASGSASGLPHERALAADTLLRLVPRLDLKTLVMLSQRVARMDNPPHMLVARILRDPRVEVSGPLLEDCPQVTDKDLEAVISEGDPARLRMIARRRSLGHAITDSLVASGDASVHLTLVRNMEAEISQEGFLSLIASAGSNIDLLAPLCTRADIAPPMAFELFWHAPAQLRRFILSRFLTDSETLTKILRITMSTNELDQLEQPEGSMQHTIVEALERAARGRLDVAAQELGNALKVDTKTVLRILKDTQGEPLVVMLKVAGYPRQALLGLLSKFSDPEIGLVTSERDLEDLVSIFETLSFNKARILLTYWDWAQRRTGPYAPIH